MFKCQLNSTKDIIYDENRGFQWEGPSQYLVYLTLYLSKKKKKKKKKKKYIAISHYIIAYIHLCSF